MFKLLAIAVLLSVVGHGETLPTKDNYVSSDRTTNIMGGKVININEALYVVAIEVINPQSRTNTRICGGSIISDYWVITAAQCCISNVPTDYKVLMGTADLKHGGWIYTVMNVIVHENFTENVTMPKNDIALIKVRKFISQTLPQRRITLNTKSTEPLEYFSSNVTGWDFPKRFLHRVKVMLFKKKTCDHIFGDDTVLDGTICAVAFQNHEHICRANAGSPLVNNDQLIGIASFGKPCYEPYEYASISAYTDVRYFAYWIFEKSGIY